MHTSSYATALNDIDAILTTIATSKDDPVELDDTDLDGVIGDAEMIPARTLTVTIAAAVGSYVAASEVTITGTDAADRELEEVFTIVGTDGTELLIGTKGFKTVTAVVIDTQDPTDGDAGVVKIGVRDILIDEPIYSVRAVAAGNLHVQFDNGEEDTIPSMAAKEYVNFSPVKIFGDSGTTVVGMTLFHK